MTARQRRRIEKTSLLSVWLSTAFQASVSALVISAGLRGGFAWPLTARPRCSQRCSIGLRSGELAGHGSITPTLFASGKARVTRAAWWGALSCWNMRPWAGNALKKGSTCGVKMSLMYLSAFMLALTTTSWLFPCRLIAPQIITERLSLTVVMHPGANLSPLRRQTLLRPSCRSMGYGDSSEKITRIHCCIVHLTYRRAKSSLATLCRGVKNFFLQGLRFLIPWTWRRRATVKRLIWLLPRQSLDISEDVLNLFLRCADMSVFSVTCFPGSARPLPVTNRSVVSNFLNKPMNCCLVDVEKPGYTCDRQCSEHSYCFMPLFLCKSWHYNIFI